MREMASRAEELTLVGLCDVEVDSKRHTCSFLTNKVGGLPDWSPVTSRRSPRCGRCGAPLAHVVQVYCPLEASRYHRNLHVFACTGAECSSRSDCWKVLRSQCLEEEAVARTSSRPDPAQEAPPSATDWCDTADDWGVMEEEEEEEDGWGGGVKKDRQVPEEAAAPHTEAAGEVDVSSQLQDLRLVDSQEEEEEEEVPVLRAFFISVVDESDLCGEEDDDDLRHAQRLLREYERREGVAVGELEDGGGGRGGGGGGGGGEEKYEKTRARHGDAVFSRFMKKISLCPQQILRYCRGGRPLFVSEPPAVVATMPAPCGSCGGTRTFELQLMPALVSLLRRTDGGGGGGGGGEAELEFGTVLVYTCVNSCWTSGSAVEEFCFVQTDPDQQLFK